MKANKVKVKIEVEALSIDSLKGMLIQMSDQIDREVEDGKLAMQDGDSIKWKTKRKPVEF